MIRDAALRASDMEVHFQNFPGTIAVGSEYSQIVSRPSSCLRKQFTVAGSADKKAPVSGDGPGVGPCADRRWSSGSGFQERVNLRTTAGFAGRY
jgi:hypothetical protein